MTQILKNYTEDKAINIQCYFVFVCNNHTKVKTYSNLFHTLKPSIGTSSTFMIFIFITVAAIVFVIIFVPETKGLPIEEVENMLERRSLNFKFWQTSPDSNDIPIKQKNQSV